MSGGLSRGAQASDGALRGATPEAVQLSRLEFFASELGKFEKTCSHPERLSRAAIQECKSVARVLQSMRSELEQEDLRLGKTSHLGLESGCLPFLNGVGTSVDQIDQNLRGVIAHGGYLGCGKGENTEVLSLQCAGEVMCNVARTTMTALVTGNPTLQLLAQGTGNTSVEHFLNQRLTKNPEIQKCLGVTPGSQSSNCLNEVVEGVLKTLWETAKGVWSGVTWVGGKIAEKAQSTWKSLTGVEDKTSAKMLVASRQTNGDLAHHKSDPLSFAVGIAKSLFDFFSQQMKTNFGCEKWSGAPHRSQCLREMKGWNCATCNQRMNAMCGALAAVGTEVAINAAGAFLTGGVGAATEMLAAAAVRSSAGLAASIGESSAILARAGEVVVEATQATVRAVSALVAAAARIGARGLNRVLLAIKESPAARLLTEFAASEPGHLAEAGLKATSAGVKAVTYLPKKYYELIDAAAKAGYSQTQSLLTRKAVASSATLIAASGSAGASATALSENQAQVIQAVGDAFGPTFKDNLVREFQNLSESARASALGEMETWNLKSLDFQEKFGQLIESLKKAGKLNPMQFKSFNQVVSDYVEGNVRSLPDDERKYRARMVLAGFIPAENISDQMVNGVLQANQASRMYMANRGQSGNFAPISQVIRLLQDAGIDDPQARRELIKRGLCGYWASSSQEFESLVKSVPVNSIPAALPVALEDQRPDPVVAMLSKLHPEQREMTLNDLLGQPRTGDWIPAKIEGHFQQVKLTSLDPSDRTRVLVQVRNSGSSSGFKTVSVKGEDVAFWPKAQGLARDMILDRTMDELTDSVKRYLDPKEASKNGEPELTEEELIKKFMETGSKQVIPDDKLMALIKKQLVDYEKTHPKYESSNKHRTLVRIQAALQQRELADSNKE